MPTFNSYPIVTTIDLADTLLFWQASSSAVKQIAFSDQIASIQSNTEGAQTVTYLNGDTILTPAMGFVVVNSGAPVTLTLPTSASAAGITFNVLNKGAGVTTIGASGSDTIAGQATVTLAQFASVRLQADGSNLFSNN